MEGKLSMKITNTQYYQILVAEKNKKIFSTKTHEIVGKKIYIAIGEPIEHYIEVNDIPIISETVLTLPEPSVDQDLLKLKSSFIAYSKEKLNIFLKEHPLSYKGKQYSVTSISQSYLDTLISAAEDAADMGISFSPTWNDVKGMREIWSLKELKELRIEIQKYIIQFVQQQQKIEQLILNASSQEQLYLINIEYHF